MTSNSSNSCASNSSDSCNESGNRCRICQHQRYRCPYCGPHSMNRIRHSGRERHLPKAVRKLIGKVSCCKCALRNSKLGRFVDFDPKQREKLAVIKYSNLRKAAFVRFSLLNALKKTRRRCPPKTTCKPLLSQYYPKDPGAGSSSLVVMRCSIPNDDKDDDNNTTRDLRRLEFAIRQVYSNVRRFMILLSGPRSRDVATLHHMLQDLFSQLADLNHRVFTSLAPAIMSKTSILRHGLRQARDQVQAAYKALCSTAYKSGLLTRRAGKPSTISVEVQITWKKGNNNGQCAQTTSVALRLRAMALSDSLQAWVLLLRAWRSL